MSVIDNMATGYGVVKMTFDNKKFNNDIEDSERKLTGLKNTLVSLPADIGNGLSNVLSRINLSDVLGIAGVLSGIGLVKQGIKSITGVVDVVANSVSSIMNNAFDTIKNGGMQRALNIEQARFQLKGLGLDVETFMKAADYAVSGTAYGLDSAAKAASQLGASGVTAEKDLKAALRGISGVASMTGASYDEIAYVFTSMAGMGKATSRSLDSISTRGLNARAALAKYLNVTEDEIRTMVSNSEIDFQTFANAMDNAFGPHAKDANETFSGSLDNVNAALKRIGEGFATPYITHMVDLFNSLRLAIDRFKNGLKDNGAFNAFDASSDVIIHKIADTVDWINKALEVSNLMPSISAFLEDIFKTAEKITDMFTFNYSGFIENIAKRLTIVVDKVHEIYKSVEKAFDEVFSNDKNFLTLMVRDVFELLTAFNEIEATKIGDTFKSWFELARKVLITVSDVLGINKDNLTNIFNNIVEKVNLFLTNLKLTDDEIEKITNIARGLASFLDIVKMLIIAIAKAVSPLEKYIRPLFDDVLTVGEKIANWVYGLRNAIKEEEKFDVIINDICRVIVLIGKTLAGVGTTFWDAFFGKDAEGKSFVDKAKGFIKNALTSILGTLNLNEFSGLNLNPIKNFFSDILDVLFNVNNSVTNAGLLGGGAKKSFIVKVISKIKDIIDFIKNIKDNVVDFFTKALSGINWSKLFNGLDPAVSFIENVGTFIGNFNSIILQILSNIGLTVSEGTAKEFSGIIKAFVYTLGVILKGILSIFDVSGLTEFHRFKLLLVIINNVFGIIKLIVKAIEHINDTVNETIRFLAVAPGKSLIFAGVGKVIGSFAGILSNFSSLTSTINNFITYAKPEIFASKLNGVITNVVKMENGLATIIHGKETFSKIIRSLALLIISITVSLKVISDIPKDSLNKAVGALMLIMGFMTVVSVIATIILSINQSANRIATMSVSKDGERTSRKASAAISTFSRSILAMSASLFIMSMALKVVSTINVTDLITGGITLSLILTAISGILMIFGVMASAIPDFDSKSVEAVGGSILMISGALLLIAASLKLLSTMNLAEIGIAAGFAAALLTYIAILIGLLAAFTKQNSEGVLIGSVAILLVAVAVVKVIKTLAKACKDLDKVEHLGGAVAAISAVLVVIGLLVAGIVALSTIGEAGLPIIAIISLVIAALAGAIAAIALVLASISKLIDDVVKLINILVTMSPETMAVLTENLVKLANAFAMAIISFFATLQIEFINMIKKVLPEIGNFILTFVVPTILEWNKVIFPQILAALLINLGQLMNTLLQQGPGIVDQITQFLDEILFGIDDSGDGIVSKLFDWLTEISNELQAFLIDQVPAWNLTMYTIMIELLKGAAKTLKENNKDISTAIVTLVKYMLVILRDTIRGAESDQEIRDAGKQIVVYLILGIAEMFNDFRAQMRNLAVEGILGFISGFKDNNFNILDLIKGEYDDSELEITPVVSSRGGRLGNYSAFGSIDDYSRESVVNANSVYTNKQSSQEAMWDKIVNSFSNISSTAENGTIDLNLNIQTDKYAIAKDYNYTMKKNGKAGYTVFGHN